MALNTGVIGGYNFKRITTLTTSFCKDEEGILGVITINTPVATGVITVYNNPLGTGDIIANIVTPATAELTTLTYNIHCDKGLTIVTSIAAQDITVSFI